MGFPQVIADAKIRPLLATAATITSGRQQAGQMTSSLKQCVRASSFGNTLPVRGGPSSVAPLAVRTHRGVRSGCPRWLARADPHTARR